MLCRACNRSKARTGACRRDHGAVAALLAVPARFELPAGYWTAGPRSRGKVIVAAWLAAMPQAAWRLYPPETAR
jgi:hypothetical protein